MFVAILALRILTNHFQFFSRSSAISLLQRVQQERNINIMQILMHCAHQLQPDHRLLAANILLQLDILVIVKIQKNTSLQFMNFNHETLSTEQKH